tara:strand:+ start:1209 stop:1964 length:756 start_codon:yes stop_codon:yes gene_type:complete
MIEPFPCIGIWNNVFECDPEWALKYWASRYEADRKRPWTGEPSDGPRHKHEEVGPVRCRNFLYPEGLLDTEEDLYTLHLHEKLCECLFEYSRKYTTAVNDIQWQEAYRLLYYYPSASMEAHSDNTAATMYDREGKPFRDPIASTRVLVALMFLNDSTEGDEAGEYGYVGGEIGFPYLGVSYAPKMGDIMIYPANFSYSHSVEPVYEGWRLANLCCFNQGDILWPTTSKEISVPGSNMPLKWGNSSVGWEMS